MKILFVFPNILKYENISFGIGHLSSYLQVAGHETDLVDFTYGLSVRKALEYVRRARPDVVGFSVTTGDFRFSCELAAKIKRFTNVPIVFGGVHPTIMPEQTIRQEAVDIVCIGEGEEALLELVQGLERGSIPLNVRNLWVKTGDGTVVKNDVRPLFADLDRLPPVDLELFRYEKLLPLRAYEGQVMVGRGCPYQCTYCVNPVLQDIYRSKGPFVRFRGVDHILDEIRRIVATYTIKAFYFCDDVFVLKKSWLENFCSCYLKEIGLPFRCQARPEMISGSVCRLLREAGCFNIQMGIEAGNEHIRNEILKRRHGNEKIIEAIRTIKQHGMTVYVYNMVGLPGETGREIDETIALNRQVNPDFMQTSIFQPYPGTVLKKLCEQKGWLRDDVTRIRSNKFSSIVEYPGLDRKTIRRYKRRFRYLVYKDVDYRKALFCLVCDTHYRFLTAARARVPQSLRAWVNKMIYRMNLSKRTDSQA